MFSHITALLYIFVVKHVIQQCMYMLQMLQHTFANQYKINVYENERYL